MTIKLLLIKHSLPVIDLTVPAAQWSLSDEGRWRCVALAQQVAAYAPEAVVCSQEPKASETGRLLAEQLDIPWFTAANLHEHERPGPGLGSRQTFETEVAKFFAHPQELVLGAETAHQAQRRFTSALNDVLTKNPDQTLAIVAHGTVISLFMAEKTGIRAFSLWKRLGLPSVVVLSLPDFKLKKVIENVQRTQI
jgi:broad specificity phosphatase PhoE